MSERVHMTASCRKGIALAREEYDKRVQLSLF